MGVRQAIQIMSLKFVNLCRLMMNVPRPIWMSLSNFIEVLGTSKETREQLSTGLCVYGEDHCSSPKEEVEKHLQSLMDDLRLFDITDPKYWGACFGCVVLFLGVEAFVFHFSTFPLRSWLSDSRSVWRWPLWDSFLYITITLRNTSFLMPCQFLSLRWD